MHDTPLKIPTGDLPAGPALEFKTGWTECAQLIKHCFGISALMRSRGGAGLVYLNWEPKIAEKFTEFKKQRAEVAEFSNALEGSSRRGMR